MIEMGAVSKAGGAGLDAGTDRMGWAGKMAANSIFAGTVDELGGGKFANGAITGAFTYLFNEKTHKIRIWFKQLKSIFENYQKMAEDFDDDPLGFYTEIGGPLGDWANQCPESFGNTCAAKLSYALNYSGFEIPQNTPNTYLGGDGKKYFINAGKMIEYLKKNFKISKPIRKFKVDKIKNGVFYQIINEGGVSGHVDVMYQKKSASGHYYIYDAYIIGK